MYATDPMEFLAGFFIEKIRLLNKCCPGGRRATGDAFLVYVLVNLSADSIFSQGIQPAFFTFHTCDAMFFSVGSHFFLVKNAFFGDGYFFIFIFFTNFCVYSITPKLFEVFGWTFFFFFFFQVKSWDLRKERIKLCGARIGDGDQLAPKDYVQDKTG